MPDIMTFNTLLNGYCKSKKLDKALDLVQEMQMRELAPDVVTYNSYRCLGDIAIQLIVEMEAQGFNPSSVTYNSILDHLFKSSRINEAMAMVREKDIRRLIRDIIIYNIMIGGLCEAKRLEEAVNFFSSFLAKGLKPDNYTYNTLTTDQWVL